MVNCLQRNSTINVIFGLLLQVILIFVFLTIFFFSYVTKSEKDSFELQMNLVIDDIAPDLNIKPFVKPENKDIATIIIDGSLDLELNKSIKDNYEDDKKNKDQNDKIKNKAYNLMFISLGVIAFISIIFLISGNSVSCLYIHYRDAIIAVMFVAFTEYIFLELITKKYWSIDPSEVRTQISNSIQDWMKINHP